MNETSAHLLIIDNQHNQNKPSVDNKNNVSTTTTIHHHPYIPSSSSLNYATNELVLSSPNNVNELSTNGTNNSNQLLINSSYATQKNHQQHYQHHRTGHQNHNRHNHHLANNTQRPAINNTSTISSITASNIVVGQSSSSPSSSTSSSSSSGAAVAAAQLVPATTTSSSSLATIVTSTSNGYSDLLRYRSQEFYTKLVYSNGSNCNSSSSSSTTTNGNNNKESHLDYSTTSKCFTTNDGTKESIALGAKELSLNDLSQIGANNHNYHNYNHISSNKFANHPNTLLRSAVPAHNGIGHRNHYQPQHPHYANHLYSPAVGNSVTSLQRSNSSLSLSYHQQLQFQKKYKLLHNQHYPHIAQSLAAANTQVALSTHNLFSSTSNQNTTTADSGYCSAYSGGSIASGTLDSRISKFSTDSGYYHQQYHQQQQQPQQSQPPTTTHSQQTVVTNQLSTLDGKNNVVQTISSSSPSSSSSSSSIESLPTGTNYYSSHPSLSISTNGHPSHNSKLSLMVSNTSPIKIDGSPPQPPRSYLGGGNSVGRATLTRSASSGVAQSETTLSVVPNQPYNSYYTVANAVNTSSASGPSNSNCSSRTSSLLNGPGGHLVQQTISGSTNVDTKVSMTQYGSPSHHNQHHHQQQGQYGYAGNTQSYHHLYGTSSGSGKPVAAAPLAPMVTGQPSPYHKTTSGGVGGGGSSIIVSPSTSTTYALPLSSSSSSRPQRFPTTITQTKSPSIVKLVSTSGTMHAANNVTNAIMSASYHSAQHQQYSAMMKAANSMTESTHSATSFSNSSSNELNNTGNVSRNKSTNNSSSGNGGSGFPRSLFSSSSKTNKLFGSVSSIDLQCLKESQKVSVVERKSSRVSRSLKSSSHGSDASEFGSNNNGTGTISSGSNLSATSSFFRLFSSSSSKKMVPTFGISNQQTAGGCSGSSSSSSASSSSSSHTVTAKSVSRDKMVNGRKKSMFPLKDETGSETIVIPANEILFRKYFTFYDLLSATSLNRLFELTVPSGSSSGNGTATTNTIQSVNSSTCSIMSTSSLSMSSTSGVHSIESSSTTTNSSTYHQRKNVMNGTSSASSGRVATTFESSTLSSTSSYSSCASSMSSGVCTTGGPMAGTITNPTYFNTSSSIQTNSSNVNHPHLTTTAINTGEIPFDIGNDLLSPSPNYMNEIGTERQYSIELRWNNGSAEELPPEMLDEHKHNEDQSIASLNGNNASHSTPKTLDGVVKGIQSETPSGESMIPPQHSPAYAKRINIFSDGSPFAALSAHSVMCDLYGSRNSLTVGTGADRMKSISAANIADGLGSLSIVGSAGGNTIGSGVSSATKVSRCPFALSSDKCNLLEMDHGTNYYRTHFRDFEHQNWLQIHEKYGPLVVSLRKERVKNGGNFGSSESSSKQSASTITRWRVIVRTTSLIPLRGTIAALPSLCLPSGACGSLDSGSGKRNQESFNINSFRDVLQLVTPKNVNVNNFKLGSPTSVSLLLKLDELSQNTEYKIGVLYAYGDQHSEEEFYNNILDYSASRNHPFFEFMGLIASRVRLKDFKGYKAGLDVHNDTTGEYSWASRFAHVDIMFHVCPELPFTETNRQQLPRKRHIGNDIVTIIFLHEDFTGPAFTPSLIRSKFQQVFIIIKPINNGQFYRVAVARHRQVPLFGPPLKPYYSRHELKDFILTKIINAENACHSVNKFAEMAKRTRNEYLVDLCVKHVLNQTVQHLDQATSSASGLNSFKKLFGSSSSKNHLTAFEFNKDSYGTSGTLRFQGMKDLPTLLGGVMFNERCAGSSVPSRLYVHDYSTGRDIMVSILLTNEAIIVIDSARSEVIWAAPVTSIIGWTDSSGVFSTSPASGMEHIVNGNGVAAVPKRFSAKLQTRSSPDTNLSGPFEARELRLYYHQGECIQIMQRPTGATLQIPREASPATTYSKQARNSQPNAIAALASTRRNDDPILQMIRILELITRKAELREIVIKRKSSSTHKTMPTHPNKNDLGPLDLLGRTGSQFGFSLSLSTGIVEDISDQTLAAYHLSVGCKVLEVAKLSFAVMAPEELQDLLAGSYITSLTFTDFNFLRMQPRCACAWPQALMLLQKQKNQMTPPSEYENLPLMPKTGSPLKALPNGSIFGVKSIHITHNLPPSQYNVSPVNSSHQTLMNVSSTSSTASSYYSSNQNQSPSTQSYNQPLYQAKSALNLSQFNHQTNHPSPAKSGANLTITMATNQVGNCSTVSRSRSTTIANNSNGNSLKDNLIRLITMDDIGGVSPGSSTHSPSHTNKTNDANVSSNGNIQNNDTESEMLEDQIQISQDSDEPLNSIQLSLVSNHFPNYNSATSSTNRSDGGRNGGYYSSAQQSHQSQRPNYGGSGSEMTDPYMSYAASSRYSTASSTQYSSLGRNGGCNGRDSGGTTQIQLTNNNNNNNNNNALSISSNQMRNMALPEASDCYLLTAQPVRVDSTSSSSSATVATNGSSRNDQMIHSHSQQTMTNRTTGSSMESANNQSNMSGTSGNTLFSSILSSSTGTSASDTIADIVWPSMHQPVESPPTSLMIHTPIANRGQTNQTNSNSLSKNEIIVTGSESTSNRQSNIGNPYHLNDEVRKLSFERHVLADTITKLREENQRLHQESQTASQQLRKLTEWFFSAGGAGSNATTSSGSSSNSVTPQNMGSANLPAAASSANVPSTTTISIKQTPQSIPLNSNGNNGPSNQTQVQGEESSPPPPSGASI